MKRTSPNLKYNEDRYGASEAQQRGRCSDLVVVKRLKRAHLVGEIILNPDRNYQRITGTPNEFHDLQSIETQTELA